MKQHETSATDARITLELKEINLLVYALKVADFHNKKENAQSVKLAESLEKVAKQCQKIAQMNESITKAFNKWQR